MILEGEKGLLERTPRREILRYMGIRSGEPDPALGKTLDRCFSEMLSAAEPRAAVETDPLALGGEDVLTIGMVAVQSRDLSRNLRGCRSVYWMAATLGAGADRVIRRAGVLGAGEHLCCEAIGSAMAECWCDYINDRLKEEAAKEGTLLRPRFSPGYGDFSLEHQTELFRILEVQQKIGVTLTGSLLMMPSKSVTAVIGLSEENTHCMLQGCEACGKRDCSFRRNQRP